VEQGDVVDGRSRWCAVELVIEDRAHRAVGQGANLDGSGRCGFEASGAERLSRFDALLTPLIEFNVIGITRNSPTARQTAPQLGGIGVISRFKKSTPVSG
jgi:hypothetical protein